MPKFADGLPMVWACLDTASDKLSLLLAGYGEIKNKEADSAVMDLKTEIQALRADVAWYLAKPDEAAAALRELFKEVGNKPDTFKTTSQRRRRLKTLLEAACLVSRAHVEMMTAALAAYGDHGSCISAIGRDHFPNSVKSLLRSAAKLVAKIGDTSLKHGFNKHMTTAAYRTISSVAAQSVGHGFYGPQP